ncbi:TetR/AcrR family transcriptional regulator [Patulibacter minatonensis]|uniref:TetR/AcrR family transcriptional regulator n=1 Tax=Patulibacter minatonensis TaxID=298163 RepID=UPI00047A898E|nr:TetR/AcrR family transcriptional regulator [Patulibacter minatonensis]
MAEEPSRRDALIAAAVEVFSRKGFAATSVQEIADAAGIRKPSVYKHVSSKEDLLFAILDIAHEQSEALVRQVEALGLPPLERLYEYLRRHVLSYLEDERLLNVFFREWRSVQDPERKRLITERRRGYDRYLRGLVEECRRETGADEPLDTRFASFYILGAVNATPDWFRHAAGDSAESVARDTAQFAVNMIRRTRIPA